MTGATVVTPRKRAKFLKALAKSGVIDWSAKQAGFSRTTAWRLKQADPEFSAAWQEAIDAAMDDLEKEAHRRARHGCKQAIFYKGSVVGSKREYSDTLMIFLLKANRPEKYRERYEVQHAGNVKINVEVREMVVRTRSEAQAAAGLIESERVSDNGKA